MSDSKYMVYAQRAYTKPFPIGWEEKSTLPCEYDDLQSAIKRCDTVYEGYMQVSSIPGFALAAIQFSVRRGEEILYSAGNI